MASAVDVDIDGRHVRLTNLDKVLFESGFTKAEVIDYAVRVADVAVPHLASRCITFRRFPDGTDGEGFFEKRCPEHRPEWVEVALGPGDRKGGIDYCCIDSAAALVWAANMAAIELHAPMALAADLDVPRALVFDFDPGPGTSIEHCCQVALRAAGVLDAVGLRGWCKTSGSKGLQMYVPLNTPTATHDAAAQFALAVGQVLERQFANDPTTELGVTTVMAKSARPGKVFVDWSQNSLHKTTIAPYSLRARPEPTVSTPVTWDEVAAAAAHQVDLRFETSEVLARIEAHGDLFEPVLTVEQELPEPSTSR